MDLENRMQNKSAGELQFFQGTVSVKVTRAFNEPALQAQSGSKYGRVQVADSSTRLEVFFFDETALHMAAKLVQDGYFTLTAFFIRKQEYGVGLTAHPAYSELKRLVAVPATCTSIAAPRADENKYNCRAYMSGVNRVFLNMICAGCDKDILGTDEAMCKTVGCNYKGVYPPHHAEEKNFKVILTFTVSQSTDPEYANGMVSVMMMHANKNQMAPHLMKLFPARLLQQLLKSKKVSYQEVKALLIEMVEVWALCITNSGQMMAAAFNYTNRYNKKENPDAGGRRYLIDLDLDYTQITDQVRATTDWARTTQALENLLTPVV